MRKIFLVVSGVIAMSASAHAQDIGGMMDARTLSQIIATADICGYRLDADKTSAMAKEIVLNGSDMAKSAFAISGEAQKFDLEDMGDTERKVTCSTQKKVADDLGILIEIGEVSPSLTVPNLEEEMRYSLYTCQDFTNAIDTFTGVTPSSPNDALALYGSAKLNIGVLTGIYQQKEQAVYVANASGYREFMSTVFQACRKYPDEFLSEMALIVADAID